MFFKKTGTDQETNQEDPGPAGEITDSLADQEELNEYRLNDHHWMVRFLRTSLWLLKQPAGSGGDALKKATELGLADFDILLAASGLLSSYLSVLKELSEKGKDADIPANFKHRYDKFDNDSVKLIAKQAMGDMSKGLIVLLEMVESTEIAHQYEDVTETGEENVVN